MLNVGQKIKERRELLGMTQDELAEKSGYKSRSSINKIEKGGNDLPQSKVALFAKILQTTPAYLMGWEEDSQSKDLDIRRIERARSNMPQKEKDRMMNIIEAAFSEYFSDDFIDEDIDE